MRKKILITGGAGFIGANLASRLLSAGHTVHIFDNLSRQHVVRNLSWLMSMDADRIHVDIADIRDRSTLKRAVRKADHVFHLAAQVAVTSSVADPKTDFDINMGGTIYLLEEIRSAPTPPTLIYTSTNKVYGSLEHLALHAEGPRYVPVNQQPGVDETTNPSFHSPYGCSKGAAEQYVLDYSRTYGIRTAVFRMSSIYGTRQFGTEDQGWVAHIMSRAIAGKPVTIYGDGRQVRDILYIDDLIDAFLVANDRINDLSGEAFNIGGGPENSISLLELIEELKRFALRPAVAFGAWRLGDQKYYVSDTAKFRTMTGWSPQVRIPSGLLALHRWLMEVHAGAEILTKKAS